MRPAHLRDTKAMTTLRSLFRLQVLLMALFCASQPVPAHTGNSRGKILVDGQKRSYLLHVPKSYAHEQKQVPLVLVFHGAFGSSHITRWDSRMSEQAEKDGFIVAYPNALFGTWNAGNCCGISKIKIINDVGFVSQLIDQLQKKYRIDPKRIYVAGVSNGGMLAYKLGRELSDRIAAIAPIEGCMYPDDKDVRNPVSVIAFHGTRDPVIPYGGGTGSWLGIKLKVPSVAETIEFWTKHDGCETSPEKERANDITRELFKNGKDNAEVCLYTLTGGGHIWPGGRRALLTGHNSERDLSATETMCNFFWAHPKTTARNLDETTRQN